MGYKRRLSIKRIKHLGKGKYAKIAKNEKKVWHKFKCKDYGCRRKEKQTKLWFNVKVWERIHLL